MVENSDEAVSHEVGLWPLERVTPNGYIMKKRRQHFSQLLER